MNAIFWKGYCHEDRIAGISKIQSAISICADIVDFTLFSDLEIAIVIEVRENKINELQIALSKIIQLESYNAIDLNSSVERTIYLNVTFEKGVGNMIHEIPKVDG